MVNRENWASYQIVEIETTDIISGSGAIIQTQSPRSAHQSFKYMAQEWVISSSRAHDTSLYAWKMNSSFVLRFVLHFNLMIDVPEELTFPEFELLRNLLSDIHYP